MKLYKMCSKAFTKSRVIIFLLLALMAAVFYVSKNFHAVFAQKADTERRLVEVAYDNKPIAINEISLKGKKVKFDENFSEGGDWLNDLKISFKNVSGRTITYVNFLVALRGPKPEPTGFPASDNIIFGYRHLPNEFRRDEDRVLKPGESAEMSLSPLAVGNIKRLLAEKTKDINDLTVAQLSIVVIMFSDGTRWAGGRYSKPDPSAPGRFIPEDNMQ